MNATLLFPVCLPVALSVTICSLGLAEPSGSTDEPLAQLLAQYQLPRTLHCKIATTTTYETIPPGLYTVAGWQEYWVDGPNYRVVQTMDSSVSPDMSHDVRWDGERFQWLNLADSTLIVSAKPRQKVPFIGEPIPLLPLEFLNPGGAELGVRLSLDELRGVETRSRLAEAHFETPDQTVAEFPGGAIGDTDTIYRMQFGGSTPYLPTLIKRLSSDGVAIDTDELEYEPVECTNGVIYLPSSGRISIRTMDNRPYMVMTFKAAVMEADIAIPPETFTVDFQRAKHVIDIDRFSSPDVSENAGLPADRLSGHADDVDSSSTAVTATPADGAQNQSPLKRAGLLVASVVALITGCGMFLRTKSSSGVQR